MQPTTVEPAFRGSRDRTDRAGRDSGSRARAIERELLIDLQEWADEHGVDYPFAHPAALTLACWGKITRIPCRLIHLVSVEARVLHVMHRAAVALERVQASAHPQAEQHGFRIEFGVDLPTASTCGGTWTTLYLESGSGDQGERVLTIGLPRARRDVKRAGSRTVLR